MVFVFGSNLAGIHGAGAAAYARMQCGAEMFIGFGHRGDSFAIPTKDLNIQTMALVDIAMYIDVFIRYATKYPELTFKVSRIGCGLAGYSNEDIAPLFVGSPLNCQFDSEWKPWLGYAYAYWGTK